MYTKSPPFSTSPLVQVEPRTDATETHRDPLHSLLPASYLTDTDDVAAASRDVQACISKELDLQRLNNVFGWLWIAGRPMPPRPLHFQLVVGREIVITEQMDLHLVWTTGRIFLKPIPRFLLDTAFWAKHICCREQYECFDKHTCTHGTLWRTALGFLFSYAALIRHESDFYIAQQNRLLPPEVSWHAWMVFVEHLDTEHVYPRTNERFLYGELRLSRLNKIYLLLQRPYLLRRYMSHWHQYGTFFQDNLAWLASATVYIAIVLNAMQVGLATETLADNDAFQSASYGFTVFSILAPLAAVGTIVLVFSYMFIDNWVATVAYRRKRFQHFRTSLTQQHARP